MKKKTVASVRGDVDKFQWDLKKKSLEGDLQGLKILYWQVVTHEILGDLKLDPHSSEFDPNHQKDYLAKIVNSYLGIFYRYFEVTCDLKKRFDGLPFGAINNEHNLWEDWNKELKYEMWELFYEIRRHTTFSVDNGYFMDLDHSSRDIRYSLNAYSDVKKNKTISIESFLNTHRFFEINTAKIPDFPYVFFRYKWKESLVNKLHRLAD